MDKQPVISEEEFRQQFVERKQHYERLAFNLKDALKTFLGDKKIPYLEVLSRVKDVDSAYEKVFRKEYSKPFEQIEDWCGLRIICYYPSDIDLICDMLTEEFDVKKQEDTAKRLAAHEFGYRSMHFILQIKKAWASTPNYRFLEGYKAEIQVRTILMHAWAEIEHKLSYKSAEQVPEQFKRKLFRLSAKFEEADEQFEELRNGINDYREKIREEIKGVPSFINQELNLDTLQAFLELAFPGRDSIYVNNARDLLEEIQKYGISMANLVEAYETIRKSSPNQKIPDELFSKMNNKAGAMRSIMDIYFDKYFAKRKNLGLSKDSTLKRLERINKGRKLIGKEPYKL